jgi:integrase
VRRKLGVWRAFLGENRAVESLSPADVERFVASRREGAIGPDRKLKERTVGMTTVWHDRVALATALNFATRHRDARGRPLLGVNPLTGVRVPKTVSPTRPVADAALYEPLRAIADQINGKFALALDLAFSTGHRIDAILKLRWSDVNLSKLPHAPHGTIRWRGEHDKIDNDHVVPLSELTSAALLRAVRECQAIGDAWIFPSESDESRPVDRHLASRWLRRAEKLAKLDHVTGRGWHAFRRGWASARKHLPDVDVAAAGGWKDTATMKRCYQHADAVGVLRVVTEPIRRVSLES